MKKTPKSKKILANTFAAIAVEAITGKPPTNILTWGNPKQESNGDWDVVTWTTECGRYKVGRSQSNLVDGEHHFSALYSEQVKQDHYDDAPHYSSTAKNGYDLVTTWKPIELERDKAGRSNGRPRDYRTLLRAFETCEKHLASILGSGVDSNASQAVSRAIAEKLDSLPRQENSQKFHLTAEESGNTIDRVSERNTFSKEIPMSATIVKLDRTEVKKLFVSLGLLKAHSWDDKKLQATCCTMQERLDDDEEMRGKLEAMDEAGKSLFGQIVDAVKDESEIEFAGPAKAPKEKKEKAPKAESNGKAPKEKKAPKTPKGGGKGAPARLDKVFGEFSVCSVLRWMGSEGWSAEDADKALTALKIDHAMGTVYIQTKKGKNGNCEMAALTGAQKKELKALTK